jgi:putative beta-phosphoglucomutase
MNNMYAPTSPCLPFGHEQEVKSYLENRGFDSFQPQAVLFDMDGVLYDSMPNHARCWQEAMTKFGLKMTAADVYATEGMRGVETIRLMVKAQQGRDISEDEAQMMYDEKARLFGLLPKAPIMEGVLELMEKIKTAGMRIVVVTGSGQRPLIERLQHDFKGFVTADKIVSAYDVTRGKPAPDPYLMGLQKAGDLLPWQGIVVENAPMGVRAGVAAKIFTIAVNSGPLPNATLAGEGANIVFDRMTQLRDTWMGDHD